MNVFTVHAYRWGDRERHSYIVGVYKKKAKALKAADMETEYRGGKYECEVIEWSLDEYVSDRHSLSTVHKVVKELPGMP